MLLRRTGFTASAGLSCCCQPGDRLRKLGVLHLFTLLNSWADYIQNDLNLLTGTLELLLVHRML